MRRARVVGAFGLALLMGSALSLPLAAAAESSASVFDVVAMAHTPFWLVQTVRIASRLPLYGLVAYLILRWRATERAERAQRGERHERVTAYGNGLLVGLSALWIVLILYHPPSEPLPVRLVPLVYCGVAHLILRRCALARGRTIVIYGLLAGLSVLWAATSPPPEYLPVGEGHAFFVSPAGTALTDSHVVSYWPRVRGELVPTDLLAVVDGEFYGVTVVCAHAVPPELTLGRWVPFRDVARIQLTSPRFPFAVFTASGSHDAHRAVAHRGPLPRFPARQLGAPPTVHTAVTVLRPPSVPFDSAVVRGTVNAFGRGSDGTPYFGFTVADGGLAHGDSGSPVVDARHRVVGIVVAASQGEGVAVSSTVLDPGCP